MRTEVKLAVVVVLLAVMGVTWYFLSHSGEKPIELTSAKPAGTVETPAVRELSPPGRSEPMVTEKIGEPTPTASKPAPVDAKPKPLYTIDLNPAPTSRPARDTRGQSGLEASGSKLVPNQGVSLDVNELAGEKPVMAIEKTKAAVHIVKANENLFQISKQYYGSTAMWKVISKANRNVKPRALKVGMKLTIPAATRPAEKIVEKPSATAKPQEKEVAKETEKLHGGKTYTVQEGDTFYSIARKELGSAGRWEEIFKLNKDKLKNEPKNLRIGQTIVMPAK